MAISSAGIGSGLDVESIVSKLVALEKRPIAKLESAATSIQTKISTYSKLKSLMATFSDAASKLTRDSGWNGMAATSSNSSAVAVSITGLASATSFGISVQQLARAQSVASTAITTPDAPVGGGTMTIQLGTWLHTSPPPTFTAGSASAVNVTVGATDSLTQIAAKINDANAGVTATVLRDATGERLLVRSKTTGEASGFRIQVTEDGGAPGLSALAFDPQNSAGVGMAANTIQYAQNTKAKINGIDISSANTTFADAVPGLSIAVSQVTTSDAEVSVTSDTASMKKNITAFVDAYNAINDLLSASTKYDDETKTAGIFQGDSSAVALQNALRQQVAATMSGDGVYKRLSDIGIDMQRGGKLAVTGSKLDAALKNPDALKAMFATNVATDSDANGLGVKLKAYTSSLLSFDGMMNSKADALSAAVKRNAAEQDKVNDRAAVVEKRLRAQYTALDTKMGSLSALNSYISQQVSQWNKS